MKHEIIFIGYEIPDNLRLEMDTRYERGNPNPVPIEDRELRVVVETDETNPTKVKAMLRAKLMS